jgi:hypothetical protein
LFPVDKLRRIIRTKNTGAIAFEKYSSYGFLCEFCRDLLNFNHQFMRLAWWWFFKKNGEKAAEKKCGLYSARIGRYVKEVN